MHSNAEKEHDLWVTYCMIAYSKLQGTHTQSCTSKALTQVSTSSGVSGVCASETWMVKLATMATMESQNEGGIGGILTQIRTEWVKGSTIFQHKIRLKRDIWKKRSKKETMNKNASNHETVWKISKAKAFKRYEQILQLWNESFLQYEPVCLVEFCLHRRLTGKFLLWFWLYFLGLDIFLRLRNFDAAVPSMTFHDRSWLRWLTPDISPLQLSWVPHVDLTFSWLNPGVLQGLIKSLSFTTSFCF